MVMILEDAFAPLLGRGGDNSDFRSAHKLDCCNAASRPTHAPRHDFAPIMRRGAMTSRAAFAAAASSRSKSGGAQPAVAVGRARDLRGGRQRRAALLGLAIHDIGDVATAQAEIGQGTVIEGAELGESALALAPSGETGGNAAEETCECRHDTTPFEWR